jgi:hypothetical protein
MGEISNILLEYIDFINVDEHQRYKSWEHCYMFFQKEKIKREKDIDLSCLNLAFYLASWGMYRGSSFLLQRDYKVHKYAVSVLYNNKYNKLWDIDFTNFDESLLELIFSLKSELIVSYKDNIKSGESCEINVTDTLVTKIILGTMGCVPAYDRFFVNGLRLYKIQQSFNKTSFMSLIKFYQENRKEFDQTQCKLIINPYNVKYPIMKLIDMFFWEIGVRDNRLSSIE